MDIEKYLKERVDDQIKWYDKKSTKAQHIYKVYQTIEIILAAAIPLLSGYATKDIIIAITVGILGATITVIESITKLNKYHENWIQYRSTCELLKYQKNLFITHSAPYNTEAETIENLFVRAIEQITSSENNQWKDINTQASKQKDKTS